MGAVPGTFSRRKASQAPGPRKVEAKDGWRGTRSLFPELSRSLALSLTRERERTQDKIAA
jgi:hypothetical protein